jgi:queuine tRNA-ribosyltransferase
MTFQLLHTDSKTNARAGVLSTAHGVIETPIFMPVGTLGGVKATHMHELRDEIGAQIILGNTYHLYLRPGMEILAKAGGIHHFINWEMPVLTDSGGFQVYSLSGQRTIREEGVTFRSHIDGSKHFFSPERAIDIQRIIGADIIMAFDECTPYPCDYKYAKSSMEMTHRWLRRCCDHFDAGESKFGYRQILAPIVQGSTYPDLRRQSAEVVAGFGREVNAIGGLSVGEPAEEMYAMAEEVCGILPSDRPRYLMGVGTPENILENIALGVDMFDCVLPSRNARHGKIYTSEGILNIRNAKWADDFSAIDSQSPCQTSRSHSKAYLRHLLHSGELLGMQLATLQNLGFYLWLIREAREKIIEGTFAAWKDTLLPVIQRRL